jgi:hypothetical protein
MGASRVATAGGGNGTEDLARKSTGPTIPSGGTT